MMKQLTIEIEYCNDLPHDNYVASLKDEELGTHVVVGNNISECLKELAVSIEVLQKYEAQQA